MNKFKQILALVFAVALGYGAGQQGGKLWATDYPTGGGGGVTASETATFTNKTIDATATGNVITNIGISELEAFGAKSDLVGFADGTAATGTVQVTAGTNSAGVNKIDGVTVNSVEVANGSVDWVTSHSQTATNLATGINDKISVPDYTASASTDTVTITSVKFGTTVNTFVVAATVAGDVTTTDVNMASGVDGAAKLIPYRGNLLGNLDAAQEFIQRLNTDDITVDTALSFFSNGTTITYGTAFSANPIVIMGGTESAVGFHLGSASTVATTTFILRAGGDITSTAHNNIGWIALGA